MKWKLGTLALVWVACSVVLVSGCEQKKTPDTPQAPAHTTDAP